ncbi:hypothetical protein GNM00_23925 [Salmonella enterica]|nr:hypothetical protein [Salmonella enterica]
MSELTGLHPRTEELDAYGQYLLTALLKKAATDAGRKLNQEERRAVADDFFASRPETDRKTQVEARRSALMSRKMRDIRAQEKSNFQWNPARPRR